MSGGGGGSQCRGAVWQVPGLEADDMIATLAVRGVDAGFWVDIASPDKVGAAAKKYARAAALIPPGRQYGSAAYDAPTWLACSRGDRWSSGLCRRRAAWGVRKGRRAPGGAPLQDFFQLLRPGLELLRHPNKAAPRGQFFERYGLESFRAAFQDLEPHQVV